MANKIYTNHTLEEYKKKYRNRQYRLLKVTKKEVEDFDKKNPTNTKGYLLKDRKWWLIGDTYYEIPKAPRYTWFRNLNGAVQIGTCALLGCAVAAAIVVPTVIAINNKQSNPDIKVIGADIDKNASSIALNKDSTVAFTYADNKDFVKINYVKVGDKEISESDYTLIDGNSQSRKIVIKAKAMTSVKVEISVELKDKVTETNREKFIRLYGEYWNEYNNSTKVYTKNEISKIYRVTASHVTEEMTITNVETIVDGNVRKTKVSYEGEQSGSQRIDTNNYGIATLLLDIKDDNSLYTFHNDGKIEYYDENATENQVYHLVVNKFGYIEAMDRINSTGYNGYSLVVSGEPIELKTVNVNSDSLIKDLELKNIKNAKVSEKISSDEPTISITYAPPLKDGVTINLNIKNGSNVIQAESIFFEVTAKKEGSVSFKFNAWDKVKDGDTITLEVVLTDKEKFAKLYTDYQNEYQDSSSKYTPTQIPSVSYYSDDKSAETTENVKTVGYKNYEGVRSTTITTDSSGMKIDIDTNTLHDEIIYNIKDSSETVSYDFTHEDYIYYKNTNAQEDEIVSVKINKFGYVTEYKINLGGITKGYALKVEGDPVETAKGKFLRLYKERADILHDKNNTKRYKPENVKIITKDKPEGVIPNNITVKYDEDEGKEIYAYVGSKDYEICSYNYAAMKVFLDDCEDEGSTLKFTFEDNDVIGYGIIEDSKTNPIEICKFDKNGYITYKYYDETCEGTNPEVHSVQYTGEPEEVAHHNINLTFTDLFDEDSNKALFLDKTVTINTQNSEVTFEVNVENLADDKALKVVIKDSKGIVDCYSDQFSGKGEHSVKVDLHYEDLLSFNELDVSFEVVDKQEENKITLNPNKINTTVGAPLTSGAVITMPDDFEGTIDDINIAVSEEGIVDVSKKRIG